MRPLHQGFVLAWSVLLSLLLASLVVLGSHGSALARRSGVNLGEQQRVEALARLALVQAQTKLAAHQTLMWRQQGGRWDRYQRQFSLACLDGLCHPDYDLTATAVLSGQGPDPSARYVGRLGQRVIQAPRYVWVLLGQLPDGRLSYRVSVRAWGIDQRTVVTLHVPLLLAPPPQQPLP